MTVSLRFGYDPPSTYSKDNEEWRRDNSIILTRFWNSMEPHITPTFMFLDTIDQIWEAL